jgi:hypothetical protein
MRGTRLLAVLGLALVTALVAAGTETRTSLVYPVGDVYVASWAPDLNLNGPDLYVSNWWGSLVTYLRFDPSAAVPAGGTFQSATLWMPWLGLGYTMGTAPVLEACVAGDGWDEYTVTWNTRPGLDACLDTQDMVQWCEDPPGPAIPFDVTDAWAGGGSINLALVMSEPEAVAYFASKECDAPEYSPCLEVTYTVETGESDPPLVAASATPLVLWPPDGKKVDVVVSGNVQDESGITAAWVRVEDEYGELSGGYGVTLDRGGNFVLHLALTASRAGNDRDGRHYTITAQATDEFGNTGYSAPIDVCVPHDQGKGK